jgi:WD40 repeat protein
MLAAGSKDRIYLWDIASRRPLSELLWGHDQAITGLPFSQDGKQLISAGRGIVVWDLDRRAWLERACRMANRNLSRGEWAEAMGKEVPYRRVCPGLPEPSQVLRCETV